MHERYEATIITLDKGEIISSRTEIINRDKSKGVPPVTNDV
jgi:hypothetical protein